MELNEYLTKTKQNKVSAYFTTRRYTFLSRYLKNANGKEKALDIGCYLGLFTELLKKKGYDAYGIDVDKRFIKEAKKNSNRKYLVASAEKIPFKKNSFDVILLLGTLDHIIDRGKALSEINRVLKPNGKVIITLPNTWSYFFIRSFFTYMLRGMKPYKNVHYQQNYFYWEHLINQFLKIIDTRPILTIPFFEPKLMPRNFLSNFEFDKKNLASVSAEPIFICTKRKKRVEDNTDDTRLDK